MRNKPFLIVLGVVAAALVVVVVLLATGGSPPERVFEDARGDVEVQEGPGAPETTDLADITHAEVTQRNGGVAFVAEMEAAIPRRLQGEESITWRWEVREGGQTTWLVTVDLDIGRPLASLQNTQTDFGTSTLEPDFPGSVSAEGNRLVVTIDRRELEDFPGRFEWVLQTRLDGRAGDPASPVATDRAPDEGFGQFSAA